MSERGPSEHLTWEELSCSDGTRYPLHWWDRAHQLALAFEEVREAIGCPLRVLSAYRTPAWNARIGGARMSQHVEGRALDLSPMGTGITVERLLEVVLAKAHDPRAIIRGVGIYPSFIHMDTRPTAALVVFRGKRKGSA